MICIVLGTRPEIIKMSPIVKALEEEGEDYFILHTGQHYSEELDGVFFSELGLPKPRYNVEVGSSTHGRQTADALAGIEKIFGKDAPDVVLVEGDTNTVLAGALAASKMQITVGHVEAGLRSYDRGMPEEVNRVLTDHCSDLLFAPTEKNRDTLVGEGISKDKIHVTGNTIVDAIMQNKDKSDESEILDTLGIEEGGYFLATAHRQENVDNEVRFKGIIEGLELVGREFGKKVVYPLHPRSRKMLAEFNITSDELMFTDPVGFFDNIKLMQGASIVLTDSGGIQEETCTLKVPCVTLRDNTERPETIDVGGNVLAGADKEIILEKTKMMMDAERTWVNPFGDGHTGEKIVSIVCGK